MMTITRRFVLTFAIAVALSLVLAIFVVRRFSTHGISLAAPASVIKKTGTGEDNVSRDNAPGAIHVPDVFHVSYVLKGVVFAAKEKRVNVISNVSTALIHSFSPYTEARFREMMIDPPKEHRIYANSPAIIWHKDKLLVVMRIWLEKEKYDLTAKKTKNKFSDNYFYAQTFDSHFRPLDGGQTMGMPTPNQWSIGDGPIEPRAFEVGGNLYLTFNTGVYLKDGTTIDSTFMWDFDGNKAILPSITGGAPMQFTAAKNEMARDKHWSAFVISSQLFFTYNLDPLRILHCSASNGSCTFVHFEGARDYKFEDTADVLRGGTPFVRYMNSPYFVTIVHVTLFKNCPGRNNCHWKRYYTANILVLRTAPIYKVVYCSGPLRFHEHILQSIPIVRFPYIKDPFVFPVGLILEDSDTLAIGSHVNDHTSVVFRLRGLSEIMSQVANADNSAVGPPVGALHQYARAAAKEYSGYDFL